VSIFREFDQGDADIQTRFGGMGLGLAICHAMVEAHRGTICAASEGKGKGATFSVTLPVVKRPAGNTGGGIHSPQTHQPVVDTKVAR